MPKITSVEPQKKNPKRFNVFMDGEFAFGADEDLVVFYRLVPGKVVEREELDKLIYEAEVGKLMERVYGLFSVRQRSEKEIRDYLRNLSFKRKIKEQEEVSAMTINLLVERLKQKGLVNDLEFAKAWVEARRKSKQKGERALKMELFQKGIDREIIEKVLSEPFDFAQGEEDLAKLALEKKMKAWRNLPPQEFKKKAYEFLMRKGFDYSVAKDAVENIRHMG